MLVLGLQQREKLERMFASDTGVDEDADDFSSDADEPLAQVAIPAVVVEHLDEEGHAAKVGGSRLVTYSTFFSGVDASNQ